MEGSRIGRYLTWMVFGAMIFLIVAAVSIPNLLRSKKAAEDAMTFQRVRSSAPDHKDVRASSVGRLEPIRQEIRKIVQTATLELEVNDVSKAVMLAADVARENGGYLEASQVTGNSVASVTMRVRADRFDHARASLVASARRIGSEQVNASDVTSQYVDLDSHLRNARAEEAQYLEIMKRAGNIKDTLAVAERLADVRGRIEQMQGEINVLSHQVEMATISLTIHSFATPAERALRWHPLKQLRSSFLDGMQALAAYADAMIALAMYLPVMLAWLLTIVAGCVVIWKTLRWTWRKWFAPTPAAA